MADAPAKPANLDEMLAQAVGHLAGTGARPYDLTAPKQGAREPFPALERIHARFAPGLRAALSEFLGRDVSVTASPLAHRTYREFAALLPAASIHLVEAAPLPGRALVALDARLVFLTIDLLFGGSGRCEGAATERPFSATEQRIVRVLLGVILAAYEHAWTPTQALQLHAAEEESENMRAPDIAAPSDAVASTVFTVACGASSAQFHLCLPHTLLEPIWGILASSAAGPSLGPERRRAALLSRQLQGAEVDVAVSLGGATLSLRDILHMQVGDIIPITVPEHIRASVDDVPILEGRYGTHGNHYAIQVERLLGPEDPDAPPLPPGAQHGR